MQISSHNPSLRLESLAEMEFSTLADFNTGHIGVFWSSPGGPGPWEMHPDSDEFLQILEGEVEIEVLPATGSSTKTVLNAGSFMVVPQGLWHRHNILKKSQELYLSPAATQHSHEEDPRG